jgi:hypothetical protein
MSQTIAFVVINLLLVLWTGIPASMFLTVIMLPYVTVELLDAFNKIAQRN